MLLLIISVNITKGGCGKTTTVQALAEIFGKIYGKKVLCCDTAPQCNLTTVSGVNIMDCQKNNLYTLLKTNLHQVNALSKPNIMISFQVHYYLLTLT